MDFNRHRSGLLTSRRGLPLRETGGLRIRLALVLQITRVQPQQVTHLVVSFHLRDLLLNELMVRYPRPERLTRVRIRNRRITRRANHASCPRRDGVATLLQREHRDLETLAFFTNHV